MDRKIAAVTSGRAYSPLFPVITALGHHCAHIGDLTFYDNERYLQRRFEHEQPDIIVLLGDRYETLIAATVAAEMGIPIAHICGGEETIGATDNAFRHAITKLAYWHFPVCELFARRIIQMGEDPTRVFALGNPSMDNLLTIGEPETKIDKHFALVCYHPETLGPPIQTQIETLLGVLRDICRDGLQLVICGSNADRGGKEVTQSLERFAEQHGCIFRHSFGHKEWLSLMVQARFCVGNSSSFIMEGITLGKHTIMIGDRQKGRFEEAKRIMELAKIASPQYPLGNLYPFGEPGKVAPAIAEKLLTLPIPESPRKEFRWFE